MAKKALFVLVLVALLSGSVFAKEHRHKSGSMLLGIDLGLGITPSISKVREDVIPAKDYAVAFDVGVNFDYYLFPWLSFNSGLFVHSGIYLLLNKPLILIGDSNFTDWAKTPVCFTLPIMAHINIPVVEFLYLGAGLTLNFPFRSMLDSEFPTVDTKGTFFVGIPLDFGFDFVKPGKGGARFFFRLTPEIHEGGGKPVLFGFMWQIYNFKLKG